MKQLGPYLIERELARGGMGVVFLARDPRAGGALRALKLVPGAREADPVRLRRFRREAEALQRLDVPGVVRVHEVGDDRGAPFLVMDFVEGESLARRLARGEPWAPDAAAALVAGLAETLERCHARGVLHRDLKPDNVLLTPAGEPVLIDFGLARDVTPEGQTRLTRTGALLGTPGYWAPEQLRGDPQAVGPHTDVFGLGAVLFALLTGHPPAAGESLMQAIHALQAPQTPPSSLRPDVPPALDAVCLRALARTPADRFPSAGAFAAALRALPGAAAPRRPAVGPIAGALAGVVALGVVALGVGAGYGGRTPPPASPPSPAASSATPAPLAPDPAVDKAQSARDALERGRRAFLAGDLRGARADFREAIQLDPTLGVAWVELAGVVRSDGDATAARELLEQAARAAPDSAPVWRALAGERQAAGDLAGAEAACDRLLTLSQRDAAGLGLRGQLRLARGRPKEALSDYEQALALQPRDAAWRLGQGEAWAALGRYAEAEAVGRALLEAGPDPAATLLVSRCLGQTRGLEGIRAAGPLYDAALAQAPNHAGLLAARGVMRSVLGLPGARADLERAVLLDPTDANAWQNLITRRSLDGDPLGAEEAHTRLVELTPGQTTSLVNRGHHRQGIGDREGALADLEAALTLNPDQRGVWYSCAKLRAELGRDRAAQLEAWDRAVSLEPDRVGLRVERGLARIALGDVEGGLADLVRARELDPDSLFMRAAHAEGLWRAGLEAAAEQLARETLAAGGGPSAAEVLARIVAGDHQEPERVAAALAVCEEAFAGLSAGATGAELRLLRADLLRALGREAEAGPDLTALAQAGRNVQVWQRLAELRQRCGDPSGAELAATQVVTERPRDPAAWVARARIRRTRGDLAQAVADYRAALALDPPQADAWLEELAALQAPRED